MHANSTTLRLILVLAALSLHTTPVVWANAFPSSLELPRAAMPESALRMGRMFKRVARVEPVAVRLSKRRRHDYEDEEEEEEDYADEDDEEEDRRDSYRRTRQYLSSNDDSYANSPSSSNDDDNDGEVVADPDGNVQIKPASLASSATSLQAISGVPSNAKATLAQVVPTSVTSDTDAATSTAAAARKVRPSSSSTSSETSDSMPSSTVTTSVQTTIASTAQPTAISPSSLSSSSTSFSSRSTSSSSSTSSAAATQTSSSSNQDDDADDSNTSAPYTGLWSTFNKNSRWFPIAIILTILIGIAALVITVALLQCIARSPRFSKKKERPMLIPSDSSWGGSETSRRSSLLSEKRGSIASLPASRVASTIGAHRNRDTYTAFPARPAAPSHRSSDASLVKEDFLPHSYDPDPETAQVTDIYPALSRVAHSQASPSRRGTPAPALYPYPDTLPTLQRMEPAAYPYTSPYTLSKSPAPPRLPDLPPLSTISRLPTILTPGRTPRPSRDENSPVQPQYQNQRVRHSHSIASSAAERRSQYGPRPGRDERQSVPRASLNEQVLSQQLGRKSYAMYGASDEPPRLPVGVMERRRWERCST